MTSVVVRAATEADVEAMNAIYNQYIVGSHVSFDTRAWTTEERLAWFRARATDGYPVLVATRDGRIVGTSWSGPWRDKAAYRPTVETTVVLAPDAVGSGVGTELYTRLLADLRTAGFKVAIAIIALPNDASIGLHTKLGYRIVGVLDGVGLKDDQYHSTMLLERQL